MSEPIRILFADDHPVVRNGIKLMLESQQNFKPVVTMLSNGLEVLDHYVNDNYDVLLLDINMPLLDGLETLKEVKKLDPNARVIMFTMHNEHHYINEAIKNGARGYILKQAGIQELIKAIKTVNSNNYYF